MTPFVCLVNNLQPVIPIDILQLFKIGRREACSFYQDSTTLFMGFVCFLCNQFLRNLLPIPHWIRQHCWQLEPFVQTQRHMCIRRVETHRHNINANECQYKFSCGFLQVINFCNAFFSSLIFSLIFPHYILSSFRRNIQHFWSDLWWQIATVQSPSVSRSFHFSHLIARAWTRVIVKIKSMGRLIDYNHLQAALICTNV